MPEKVDIEKKLDNIVKGVETNYWKNFTLSEWRLKLASECQVYVHDENYLAKRFDQINYKFVSQKTAMEILKDNLYAILRYKYLTKSTDEVEQRIKEIVRSFLDNIKTSLIRISFNPDTECKYVRWLPDGCVAFRNGVFDFRENKWLFQYQKIRIEELNNNIYIYDPTYIIQWYINIEFQPLDGISVNNMSLEDFTLFMKEYDKVSRNYCFELMYNMSHDYDNNFSKSQFKHLCEILGYLCNQSFLQYFVLFIGTGQNGKNSLFDGCFLSRAIPMAANNDLNAIEEDKFVSGSLENKPFNIYLETDAETITKSKNLKAITGSMYQTIEHKGEDKVSGIINCKFIWAGNDQDKIKFSDNTTGFRRRINIFETYYTWDAKKKFLLTGDYYDTTFSQDLHELKDDILNTIVFIYFAMFGIKSATNNFTKQFSFTSNDWKMQYVDADFDLKEKLDRISLEKINDWMSKTRNHEAAKTLFYDKTRKRLYDSASIRELGINNFEEFVEKFIKNDEVFLQYFIDNDYCYMSIRHIQEMSGTGDKYEPTTFTQNLKKIYGVRRTENLFNNKPYVKVKFVNNKLKIMQ
ncbi:MAG: DUF5906 domain-containing protein [Erysipelotrichaceae bacterium]|nr:DUF5906 domain-containing protein [Erysipelotrichaceae bacterium]